MWWKKVKSTNGMEAGRWTQLDQISWIIWNSYYFLYCLLLAVGCAPSFSPIRAFHAIWRMTHRLTSDYRLLRSGLLKSMPLWIIWNMNIFQFEARLRFRSVQREKCIMWLYQKRLKNHFHTSLLFNWEHELKTIQRILGIILFSIEK